MTDQETIPEKLEDFKPSGNSYRDTGKYVLFGVDSDGCVDKGMRYKHGGPFPRAAIEIFNLGAVAEALRIAWTFVNEIEDRGCPRFKALAQSVDRVREMPPVQEAEENNVATVPDLAYLKAYLKNIAEEKGFGDNVLNDYISGLSEGEEKQELELVAEWSRKVNGYVDTDCPYIKPFENAINAIKFAHTEGIDSMIVSGTPEEHLRETWKQHGLLGSILGVFGRESGKKNDHLNAAMQAAERDLGRKYDFAVMFGDAPGDDKKRKAASEESEVEIRFMPVRVGYEQEDWAWFSENFLKPGKVLDYSEEAEKERVEMFYQNLDRPWRPEADITMLFPLG